MVNMVNLNKAELLARIEGHVIDEGKVVGCLRCGDGGSRLFLCIATRPSHANEAREVLEQGRLRLVLTLPERDDVELPDPGKRTDVVQDEPAALGRLVEQVVAHAGEQLGQRQPDQPACAKSCARYGAWAPRPDDRPGSSACSCHPTARCTR